MASLDLKIEDIDGKPPLVDKPRSPGLAIRLMQFLRRKRKSTTQGWTVSPATTSFTATKIADILRDVLQPDSAMSLEDAANSLLAVIPVNAPQSGEVRVFGDYCLELAEQIPYNHPSVTKLPRLLRIMNVSSKFTIRNKISVCILSLLDIIIMRCH
jgi:hypothetical protein